MKKGDATKLKILESGLEMSMRLGIESVSIGDLAKETGMSKSGLFSHFSSKENLQLAIMAYAAEDFTSRVIAPAIRVESGIPRIMALVEKWIEFSKTINGSCLFVQGIKFSDKPGKVRDGLFRQQEDWIDTMKRIAQSAVKVGDFRPDVDPEQFAYDLYSLLLGYHFYFKMVDAANTNELQRSALDQLLRNYRK